MADAYLFDTADNDQELSSQTMGEGELPVDVAETEHELIIISPIPGVDPELIEIHLDGDVLTIRGTRRREFEQSTIPEHFFSEECFWGDFSRSVILPVDVQADAAVATFKNGMLTLRIPKKTPSHHIPILVIHEN
ncbi:MAG: Hsp20/alpha crystallin family protein [Candidatus Magasanikbacteria bacterium]|nr:Hsp20/alpha crystallin family protein [Candidatus Magasanikbacteria bacterium]